jgi:hypothetical protein
VTTRIPLGSWRTLDGNRVEVSFSRDADQLEHLHAEWDGLPLSALDEVDWLARILPAVTRRLAEWKEDPLARRILVLR